MSLLAVLLFAGCGSPTDPSETVPLFQPAPRHDSAASAMQCFDSAFELQRPDWIFEVLTSDYRFSFSSETDSALVTRFGDTWDKEKEWTAAEDLFEGFSRKSPGDPLVPGASSIALTMNWPQFTDDPDHPDSTAYYQKCIVPLVDMTVVTPGPAYRVVGRHEFWLVRGDAAVLGPSQLPTSGQWYIRRWEDRTSGLGPTSGSTTSWGRLKGLYFH